MQQKKEQIPRPRGPPNMSLKKYPPMKGAKMRAILSTVEDNAIA
jgi:hypothetical protein